jgi:hypothetical protein
LLSSPDIWLKVPTEESKVVLKSDAIGWVENGKVEGQYGNQRKWGNLWPLVTVAE